MQLNDARRGNLWFPSLPAG